MPIKITLTHDPVQIDAAHKLRHKVFSEQENLFQATPDGRVLDRFDAYATTHILVAISDDEVVGSFRLNLDSELGVPADEYYDFRAHLPEGSRVMSGGMFCVSKAFRNSRLALGMLLMASYFSAAHDVTHVIAPINPEIANLLKRVGFQQLDEEQFDPHMGVTFLPMLLDIKNLNDFFFNFAESNRLHNFLGSYDCLFYRQGEHIVHAGDVGEHAFVVIEGEVEVRAPNSETVLATMGVGEVFGELALLTDDVRTADVVASSDLRVMSLAKTVFLEHLVKHPEHAMLMLKSIGQRMKHLLTTHTVAV